MIDGTTPAAKGERRATDPELQATWDDFEVALFECLLGMNLSDVTDRVILDVPTATPARNSRVDFRAAGDGSICATILADAAVLPSRTLEPEGARQVIAEGWTEDQPEGLHVSRSVDLTRPGASAELAAVVHQVVVVLREGLGLAHPQLLTSRSNGRVVNRVHLLGLADSTTVRNESRAALNQRLTALIDEFNRLRRQLGKSAPGTASAAAMGRTSDDEPDDDGEAEADAVLGFESSQDEQEDTRAYGGDVDTDAFAFESVDQARSFVASLLKRSGEVDFLGEDNGYLGCRHRGYTIVVDVRADQPAVVLSARAVHDVPSAEAALAEVNRLNDANFWVRWTLQGDSIWLSAAVPAAPLSPVHLIGMLFVLCGALDNSRDALAARLGAETS